MNHGHKESGARPFSVNRLISIKNQHYFEVDIPRFAIGTRNPPNNMSMK